MAEMGLGEGIALLQRRAKIVKALLIAGFVVAFATLVGEIAELNGDVVIGNPEPTPADQLYTAVLLANSLVALVTIIWFSMWIYRAAANVVAAGVPGFDFTPGWCVGWYFIPFANLVQPFVAMRQIWNASHGGTDGLNRGHAILTIWWTSWLASNITANISLQMTLRGTTIETYTLALQIGMVSSAISLVLAVVGIRLVEGITAAQRDALSSAHIFA